MHITRLRLENIKNYTETEYTFGRGTIAITGPNGAGKTTIIEAIAWTLFNVLDYKKDDFVRRGARKGRVEVTFVSSLDEREYTVIRDTGTSYYVLDAALGLRVADKTNEVNRFLQKHLGVEPGTDLESLFKQAIGVPQGTLTAVFLATAAERKRTFDALLKVDEYRRGADELLKTVRYLERAENDNEKMIARAEGEITASEGVTKQLEQIRSEIEALDKSISKQNLRIEKLRRQIARIEEAEQEYRRITTEAELLAGEVKRARLVLEQRNKELAESLAAEAEVNKYQSAAQRHIEALKKIAELERERTERDKLRLEMVRIESAITAVKADLRHYEEDLREIHKAAVLLAEMKDKIDRQIAIEKQLEKVRSELAVAESKLQSVEALQNKVEALRDEYRNVSDELRKAEAAAANVEKYKSFRSRENDVIRRLALARAELEHKQKLKSEITSGLCPILSQKCLNLKPGETLEGFIADRFEELQKIILQLTAEQTEIEEVRKMAEEAEKAAMLITPLRQRLERIGLEGKTLAEELAKISGERESIRKLNQTITALNSELDELGDPKAVSRALDAQIRREPEIREKISLAEKNLEKLEAERLELSEQLELYAGFEARFAEAVAEKDETEGAYRQFLTNENAARLAEERRKKAAEAKLNLELVEDAYGKAQIRVNEAEKDFDKEILGRLRAEYMDLQNARSADTARLEFLRKRFAELEQIATRIETLRKELNDRYLERERLVRVKATTEFIRETLRDAAPLIARNYVFHISAEANNLFREITGIADRTLKWMEDYSIMVEESGHLRPFALLSGGEQMAAALSVRLALLKQLSGIRIAFFDEPTANLDAGRRENLAMQIGSVRHFDQLFVISHDDTFEGYLDNEIRIGND